MNQGRRQALRLAAGMGATAALAAASRWTPGEPAPRAEVQLDKIFPDRIGVWQLDREAASFVRAADRRGQQTGIYDQVLERNFVEPGGRHVMLSVAYLGSQSSDLQLHRPEVCYRAGGFRVDGFRTERLDIDGRPLPVTQLLAQMPGRPEPITYWTVVAGRAVDPAPVPWADRLKRAMQRRQPANGLLVRVSSIEAQADAAWRAHGEFALALARALPSVQRDFVLGTAGPA